MKHVIIIFLYLISGTDCINCVAGKQPNTGGSGCEACPVNTWSADNDDNTCTACTDDLGTLTPGGTSSDDCVTVCTVPAVTLYTVSTTPTAGSRLKSGVGTATITCTTGYQYNNQLTSAVTCNNDEENNGFSGCRTVTAMAAETVSGAASVTISCTYKGADNPDSVKWMVAGTAKTNADTGYTVADGSLDSNMRTSTLTVGGRLNTDANKQIKCKWVFTSTGQLETSTMLISRGMTAHNKEVLAGQDATISCVVTGITRVLKTVKWTKKGGTDVTQPSDSSYTVTDGSYSNNEQTTTLLVKSAANTQDSLYTCVITPADAEDAKSEKWITVNLNVYTVTPNDKSVTTAVDQAISCDIAGLSAAATVKWIEPGGADILDSDTTNYVVDQGTGGYSAGSQTTTLTIKPAKLATLTSPATYKCSVKSGQYADSPEFQKDVVVTVSDNDKEGSSANIGAIVGGVVGAVVATTGAVAVAVIIYKKMFMNIAVSAGEGGGTIPMNTRPRQG